MNIKDEQRIPMLGVHIDDFSRQEFFDEAIRLVRQPEQFHYITTPNSEMVLRSMHHESYRRAIIGADLVLLDGAGLNFASLVMNGHTIPRVTGTELTEYLIDSIKQKTLTVSSIMILRRADGLSSRQQIVNFFKEAIPETSVTIIDVNPQVVDIDSIAHEVEKVAPQLIFCGLGNPYQEEILATLSKKISTQTVALAHGGALDFIIGTQKRAPKIFQKVGLEWLWRLIKQPWRYKRIYNAVIKFPIKVIHWRLRMQFQYRISVMALIFNEAGDILLGEFAPRGHWGIPKGGQDPGETQEQTARREIFEELGIKSEDLTTRGQKTKIYTYLWPAWHRQNRGYKGQQIDIVFFDYHGDNVITPDNYEVTDWQWAPRDKLFAIINPLRHGVAQAALDAYDQSKK